MFVFENTEMTKKETKLSPMTLNIFLSISKPGYVNNNV